MAKANFKTTIMIVDDQPENITILAESLKKKYTVIRATDGPQSLELAFADNRIDLILLDIMMPEMNGFEVCRRLKAEPDTCNIPVIFLTAMTANKKVIQGFAVGAVDYITKPFDSQIVMTRVKLHLELQYYQESPLRVKNW